MNQILKRNSGYTLMELVMVIILLGILSAVAIPKIGNMIDTSKESSTKQEMQMLRVALIGDASSNVGGEMADKGYIGDVGSLPPNWDALINKPSGVSDWNRNTQSGWNGPYVVDNGGDYKEDVWGNDYSLTDSTIVSGGPNGSVGDADDISVQFR